MVWLHHAAIFVFLVLSCLGPLSSAQETDAKPDPPYQIFSGTVVELSTEKIWVTRAISGQPAEKRSFLITPETKVEGKIKSKVRVTVGYLASDEGDKAMRIIVRSETRTPQPKD